MALSVEMNKNESTNSEYILNLRNINESLNDLLNKQPADMIAIELKYAQMAISNAIRQLKNGN